MRRRYSEAEFGKIQNKVRGRQTGGAVLWFANVNKMYVCVGLRVGTMEVFEPQNSRSKPCFCKFRYISCLVLILFHFFKNAVTKRLIKAELFYPKILSFNFGLRRWKHLREKRYLRDFFLGCWIHICSLFFEI